MSGLNVFILSPGRDTGGQGAAIARAFARYAPEWTVRAMHSTDTYIRYKADLHWDKDKAQELYDAADVVHHKNMLHGYSWLERGAHKPVVMHHHGSRLRLNAETVADESVSVGAKNLVSTVDLLSFLPKGAEWLPAPFELDELAYYRRPRRRGPFRIAHAPTNREVKGTAAILSAVERLSSRYDVELDIIEGLPWKVCLSRKGMADLFVDQLHLGYGNNSVEAMAMGIPVICGVDSPSVRRRMVNAWGEMPFYRATPTTIEQRIEEMIQSAELRDEWGAKGRAHVEKYHAAHAVVEQLKRVYSEAQPSLGVEHLRLARDIRERVA